MASTSFQTDFGLSSFVSGLFGIANQSSQNKFSAEQAQLDRDFQAEQAQLDREYNTSERLASQQWEEDWYNQYSSPSAMVQQYQDAGLNPALMYGQAGAATGDVASSSPASHSTVSGAVASPLAGMSSLEYLGEAVESFSKIANSIRSLREARHQKLENEVFDLRFDTEMSEKQANIAWKVAQTDEVYENVKKLSADTDLSRAQIKDLSCRAEVYKSEISRNSAYEDLTKAQIANLSAQSALYESEIRRNEKLNGLTDSQISHLAVDSALMRSNIERNGVLNDLSRFEMDKLSIESARLKQVIFQSGELFPSQKELQELGVDRAKAEKTYEYFFPQILQEYNSKIANLDMDTEHKEAVIKQILEDLDYSRFEHDYAESTGWNFDAKGLIGHLIKIPANLVYALDSINSDIHDFSNSPFNHPTY